MLLKSMPLRRADYWIVAVASMEQLIGGALSTVVSVMIPMLQLTLHPELPSFLQGIIGAMGLIGIGIGSLLIGRIGDRHGYLVPFRLCPVIMLAGCAICYFLPSVPFLILGLLLTGIGVGGGYSLDSSYISELLPDKWRLMMVGIAKSTSSLGFMGAAVACGLMLRAAPDPSLWPRMIWVIAALALVTLLMRIRWWESPLWLLDHNRPAAADKAAQNFLGKDISVQEPAKAPQPAAAPKRFSVRENLGRIIFSGVPWACEGMGIYGISVFLPVLVMALGIDRSGATGIQSIINSVDITAVVNFFMIPGFIGGLVMLRKVNNVKMLYNGFIVSAAGLLLLLASYLLKWPVFLMLAGFVIFEIAINAGPHLITFIIPARVYPVDERAEGSGIAALMGKVGAVLGVIIMPLLLSWGGMTLVLSVSAGVMLLGAAIGRIYGAKLNLL